MASKDICQGQEIMKWNHILGKVKQLKSEEDLVQIEIMDCLDQENTMPDTM
jgi:hypothetical protein